ncbi:hypothetical protein ACIBI3_44755 [Actinomadura luteofluorescens]|uniref:hypothetical protein n=1 Tax=Actinomadura luteofluorescens TaxID=46163 RepID=UPI00347E4F39
MSFYIETAGKPVDVIRHIEAKVTESDPQLSAAAELVCSDLEAMSAGHSGVYLKLSGSYDRANRNLDIQLRWLNVAGPAYELPKE